MKKTLLTITILAILLTMSYEQEAETMSTEPNTGDENEPLLPEA